jgi:hypothetical protein
LAETGGLEAAQEKTDHPDQVAALLADGGCTARASCDSVLAEQAEHGGTQLKTPRAIVLVDTREQNPSTSHDSTAGLLASRKKP